MRILGTSLSDMGARSLAMELVSFVAFVGGTVEDDDSDPVGHDPDRLGICFPEDGDVDVTGYWRCAGGAPQH